ncbi:50S ribosomal protein L13 [Desulfosudis oleivorans]|uniref:Large ribosomal subunit protein uL13 n=1 Tax=Desulfosudis oleivorans (strain DSM 6200 / JCM 39069 / Hxd3) TaxID=96561 RepID=A8ZWE8_DESOH|nr:50S ribosomal protein L13 [Desulfosudis oleivorans]ABW66756.1 ribosomal protein L13 [Desulfosudis oleivorans Hxd3]
MKKYTYSARETDKSDKWYLVDADGVILGRMASEIAARLRGKRNPLYTPHADTGDSVVVVNAEKIALTGRKWDQKVYYHHTGYVGGIKAITAKKLLEKKPEDLVVHAVRGMLPKNKLGRALLKKLKVYAGPEHPHSAQQPEPLSIK